MKDRTVFDLFTETSGVVDEVEKLDPQKGEELRVKLNRQMARGTKVKQAQDIYDEAKGVLDELGKKGLKGVPKQGNRREQQ